MKIVADQNIPLAYELFSDFGEIVRIPGREMQRDDVADADVLLVRSITKVNEALLHNTKVRFVGSCTIGFDHLDIDYLARQNITWASAPGCNANAVVQYVLSAMAAVKTEWPTLSVGIIGCGNIGGRLYHRLKHSGQNVMVYDPFLADDSTINHVSFEDVLQADIITCHTPLTKSGPYPTYHLLGEKELAGLSSDTLLINSGRGAVVDNQALLSELERRPLSVVLDVWENEPDINRQLLDKVTLGTPHIAGYSVEGKEQGSYLIYQQLCQFLKQNPDANKAQLLSNDQSVLNIESEPDAPANAELMNQLLLACYDIRKDDSTLRQSLASLGFDNLRKNYLSRREYTHFQLPEALKATPLNDWLRVIKGE